jgi:hypothetical protein
VSGGLLSPNVVPLHILARHRLSLCKSWHVCSSCLVQPLLPLHWAAAVSKISKILLYMRHCTVACGGVGVWWPSVPNVVPLHILVLYRLSLCKTWHVCSSRLALHILVHCRPSLCKSWHVLLSRLAQPLLPLHWTAAVCTVSMIPLYKGHCIVACGGVGVWWPSVPMLCHCIS